MCYRCEVCLETSKPRESRFLHVIQRTVINKDINAKNKLRKEIAKEITCCKSCQTWLKVAPLDVVINKRRKVTKKIIEDNVHPGYGMPLLV